MAALARPRKGVSRVSLRTGLALTCGVLGALAVLATGALIGMASSLHRGALELTAAMLREEIARDVELDVLMHSALANMDAAGAPTARLVSIQEDGIHEHFSDAKRLVGSEEAFSKLEANVDSYFEVRKELAGQHLPLSEVVARSGEALGLVLREAAELRTSAQADVVHTRGHIEQLDRWANLVGPAFGVAVLMSLLLFAVGSRALLVRPVRALTSTIWRFSKGDMSVRADEEAPRELRDVAHTFNQMAATIVRQRENELTSLASVAHDLNNPIGVLAMLTEPRAVERSLGSEERLRGRFALLHRQTERIHRMAQDLLDAVRAEAGELSVELGNRDLRDIAADAVELYKDVSEIHDLRLSVPPAPVLARCDRGRIEQVLQNIIANAIKYSPQGGAVSVRVGVEQGQALLAVSDEGIGLQEEQKARIFDAFQRFGPPGISGAGLGLSLVKRIIQAHGGSIDVDSAPAEGSTFRILLPLATESAELTH